MLDVEQSWREMASRGVSAAVVIGRGTGFADFELDEHSVLLCLPAGRWMGDRHVAEHARKLVREQRVVT